MAKKRSCFRFSTVCQSLSATTGRPMLNVMVADCRGNVAHVRANATNPNALLTRGAVDLSKVSFLKARKIMRKAAGRLSRVPKCPVRIER